jgi:putative DNA methylase
MTRVVLDPTAGGGSIPLEAARLGFSSVANDLNPVAALIQRATIEYPTKFGRPLKEEFERIARKFVERRDAALSSFYPVEPDPNAIPTNYIWARSIRCPHCEGIVPLSPNWRLAPNGTGVRLLPKLAGGIGAPGRRCEFELVSTVSEQSDGTVSGGDAVCPYSDCKRVIEGDEIKKQARDGKMGEQLYCVVYKRRVETRTKGGKRGGDKWVREYRAPRPEDDMSEQIEKRIEEKLTDWQALDILPNEAIPEGFKTSETHRYGMFFWRDMFNPRQLLGHATATEKYRELFDEEINAGLSEATRAAFVYLAICIDKHLNWNSNLSSWNVTLESMRSVFDRHDFSFKWSYAEMVPLTAGVGYDWVIEQTARCIDELVDLCDPAPSVKGLFASFHKRMVDAVITCKSGDDLGHISAESVDAVVMDPPYYDNVMYAELSDFFYVWLKRTARLVVPELFTRRLTNKEDEAVANPAKFAGQKGAKTLEQSPNGMNRFRIPESAFL